MEQLSLELLYQIAAALPSTSLAALQCTSKRSHAAFASNYFWRNLAKQIVPKEFANESDGDSLESPGLQPYPSEARHYKALISRYERVERNWKAGIFSGECIGDMEAIDPVLPKVAFAGNMATIASQHSLHRFKEKSSSLSKRGKKGKTIRRFRIERLFTLDSPSGMLTFDVDGENAAISSGHAWDTVYFVDTKKRRLRVKWRSSVERGLPITSLNLKGDRLASGAEHCTLWDVNTLDRIARFNLAPNNTSAVVSTAFVDNLCGAAWASGGKLIDLRTNLRVATFAADKTELTQITFTPSLFCTGSSDGVVRVWDSRNTTRVLSSYAGHKKGVRQIVLDDRKLISLSGAGKLRIVDLEAAHAMSGTAVRFFGDKIRAISCTSTRLCAVGDMVHMADFDVIRAKRRASKTKAIKRTHQKKIPWYPFTATPEPTQVTITAR